MQWNRWKLSFQHANQHTLQRESASYFQAGQKRPLDGKNAHLAQNNTAIWLEGIVETK